MKIRENGVFCNKEESEQRKNELKWDRIKKLQR